MSNWIQLQDKSYVGKKVLCTKSTGNFNEYDIGEIAGFTLILMTDLSVIRVLIKGEEGPIHMFNDDDFSTHFKIIKDVKNLLIDNYFFISKTLNNLKKIIKLQQYSETDPLDEQVIKNASEELENFLNTI